MVFGRVGGASFPSALVDRGVVCGRGGGASSVSLVGGGGVCGGEGGASSSEMSSSYTGLIPRLKVGGGADGICGGGVPGGVEVGVPGTRGNVEVGGVPGSKGGVEEGGVTGGRGGVEVGGVPGGRGGVEVGGVPGGRGGVEVGGLPDRASSCHLDLSGEDFDGLPFLGEPVSCDQFSGSPAGPTTGTSSALQRFDRGDSFMRGAESR